ncbi:MAG: Sip1-related alpha-galactosidase [Christensenellales bacterium]
MEKKIIAVEEYGKYGTFLRASGVSDGCKTEIALPEFSDCLACYRENSCWMTAQPGKNAEDIPQETQFLLLKNVDNGSYSVFFALADGEIRASFSGGAGNLTVKLEIGDADVQAAEGVIVYYVTDEDPYMAMEKGYLDIADRLKSFKLLKDKKIPRFADYFGYCTYNAFYDDISEDALMQVARAFRENGMTIGFVVLDAGWEKYEGDKLAGFSADARKFPSGLKTAAERLKRDYGVREVLCWHVFYGYWEGLKASEFEDFDVREEYFYVPDQSATDEGSAVVDTSGKSFYPNSLLGVPIAFPNDFEKFYNRLYESFSEQGADGSKVDAMTWIEAFGQGKGGRVKMMRRLINALESASEKFFGGEHINCSSCSNDFFYNLQSGAVARTSNDYFPNDVQSFGKHVYSNAVVSFFTSPILIPDWDMFQSNSAGEFHAAARAVSGGPIYCTDSPGSMDFSVLRRLASKDGRVARCLAPAKLTEECLFYDSGKRNDILRVFNSNRYGEVLAGFNCNVEERIIKKVKFAEVKTLENDASYAVYSTRNGFVGIMTSEDYYTFDLPPVSAEILHMVPLFDGIAVFGPEDKLNCVGFIESIEEKENKIRVNLIADEGCLVYRKDRDALVRYDGQNFEIPRR